MSTEELNFEEYAPAKTPFLTQAGFAATALVLSALPVHTFTQIYYLEFEAAALTYIIMTLFSAALLYMSYINVNASQSNILAHNGRITIGNHKALKMDKKELAKVQASVAATEAAAWSLAINNIVFVFFFSILSFYVLANVPVEYNYTLSVGIASSTVWYLSKH